MGAYGEWVLILLKHRYVYRTLSLMCYVYVMHKYHCSHLGGDGRDLGLRSGETISVCFNNFSSHLFV